jgi:hypothetical protein
MREEFLHFIWKYQYFNKEGLKTTSGDLVNILSVGFHNHMSGPDFAEARIKIGDLQWTGQVEIHVKASSWDLHKHNKDLAYNNVILHVVWEEDKNISREDGTTPPTIELRDRVEANLIKEYEKLLADPHDIPCHYQLPLIKDIVKIGMVEKALISRLERKAGEVLEYLDKNDMDWDETAYQLLSRGFGFKSNSEAFYKLSKVLPLRILFKHSDNTFQLEAMLFGQAGLLTGRPRDDYHKELQKEYLFLKHKHDLPDNMLKASVWKMGKLRPANFPTIRIAQLAASMSSLKRIFASLLEANSLQRLRFILRVRPTSYWDEHYTFGKNHKAKDSLIGLESVDRLIINVVTPLLAAYAKHIDDQAYMDRAILILQQIKAEKNGITRKWEELNVRASSAADSQGLIELYNSFCLNKNCLSCNIGTSILKQ